MQVFPVGGCGGGVTPPGTPPGPPRWTPVASVNRHFPNKERMIFIIYPGRFHARNLPGLLHSQSLFFSLKKKSPSGEFFFSAAINTFGFLFFSLQGLPEGSRPPTDPKIPFPYWKIDHFTNACPLFFCFNRRNLRNKRKSARDG